jgi:hypothetical protein
MNKLKQLGLIAGLVGPLLTSPALAVVVDFAGGTAYLSSGGPIVTSNTSYNNNVVAYEENGFRVDFVGSDSHIGNYYNVNNAVIHSHWASPPGGGLDGVTKIVFSKVGGGSFDLNYFVLTSNTLTGGAAASGTEQTWIRAVGGVDNGYVQMLPSENWGYSSTTQVFLGSQFDAVTAFEFYVTNSVDCFGMDEFYINEAAPPNPNATPDGASTIALLSAGFVGMGLIRRRKQ